MLIECLFVAVTQLLNDLMARTPVETLPFVDLTATDTAPPHAAGAGDGMNPFAPMFRQSIRMQLGF